MAMDSGKEKLGIIIAGGIPAPSKRKRPPMGGDMGEDAEEGEMAGGRMAFDDMTAAMDRGDKAAAYDAFKTAVRLCASEGDEEGPSEDIG